VSWRVEGRYFENCNCEVVCPCTASFALGADYDRCEVALVFHVDSGEVDGCDVGGLTVAAVADSPKLMTDGNWRLGLLIDDSASDEQAEKLGGVFSGQLGGPMEALAPLVGEVLGIERLPMEFSSKNGQHTLTVGDRGRLAVSDVIPFGSQTGEPTRLAGIFHPVGSELTIGKAEEESSLDAFGMALQNGGKSGFSSRFSWAV